MMRQLRIALAVMLLISMAAHGQQGISPIAPQATFPTDSPSTTNNDDSCDVALFPAATLLLPYFEVDFRSPQSSALNTEFIITNVSPLPQIAHVTLWTDRAFPVMSFDIFLTGYDVQGVSLYDIIARGQIPSTGAGTSTTANFRPNSPVGPRSNLNNANPNLTGVFTTCAALAGSVPGAPGAGSTTATGLLLDVQNALSRGTYSLCPTGTPLVGSDRGATATARGYVTLDVVNTCSTTGPTTSTYYTTKILFDNVLTGDYVFINPDAATGNYATSSPMVHIRAIPEGGPAEGTGVTAVNLPFTFYDRYTPATSAGAPLGRKSDRRQPLPGTFAARFLQGFPLITNYVIWREGVRSGPQSESCSVTANAAIPITEIVRFDEHENPSMMAICSPPDPCAVSVLPSTSRTQTSRDPFPQLFSPAGDIGGWMYLNLNNGGNFATSAPARVFTGVASGTHAGVSQNWVIVQTLIEGRLGGDFEAIALGNGCSPAPAAGAVIGPAANANP